jgi:arginine exporter protein ArgO
MLNQIEDISDSMNRDIQKANIKNNKKAVNIAFFDVSQMSAPMQAVYLLMIFTGLAFCLYMFYIKLIATKEEEEEKRLAKIEAKKAKKAKKVN